MNFKWGNLENVSEIQECVQNSGPMIPMELNFGKFLSNIYDKMDHKVFYHIIQNITKHFLWSVANV